MGERRLEEGGPGLSSDRVLAERPARLPRENFVRPPRLTTPPQHPDATIMMCAGMAAQAPVACCVLLRPCSGHSS